MATGSREENASKQRESSVLIFQSRSFGSINGRTATGGMAQPTFFKQPPSSTLADIAALTTAHLLDASRGTQQVKGLASLDEAGVKIDSQVQIGHDVIAGGRFLLVVQIGGGGGQAVGGNGAPEARARIDNDLPAGKGLADPKGEGRE